MTVTNIHFRQWDLEFSPSGTVSPVPSLVSTLTPNRSTLDRRSSLQIGPTISPFQKDLSYSYDFEPSFLNTTTQVWNGDETQTYTPQGLKRKWDGTDTLLEEPFATAEG